MRRGDGHNQPRRRPTLEQCSSSPCPTFFLHLLALLPPCSHYNEYDVMFSLSCALWGGGGDEGQACSLLRPVM